MTDLLAVSAGEIVATLTQANGKTRLRYNEEWRTDFDAYPLSLSMPLSSDAHPHSTVDPFLWGLLPENELVLDRWAKRFQVSARNAFRLISNVGEDCAGAIQFVPPDRLDSLLAGANDKISWLSPGDLAARMRTLRDDAGAGRMARDTGQFSLAGAQPKTALLRKGKRWGIPSGRIPTTHILKPASRDFDGHAENEHLCLAAANALGLIAAQSDVVHFDDVAVIVVERFDRALVDGDFVRIHQEDMCQALHVHPARKYQNMGGPGPAEIIALLRASVYQPPLEGLDRDAAENAAETDVWRFIDALLYNWLIGGTDAHAKNYSLLIGSRGLVRLAPLYDLASIFAYPDIDPKRAKLAMRVADKYRLDEIHLRHWERLARQVRVDADRLVERARATADALPAALNDEAAALRDQGIDHPAVDRLIDGVARLARKVRRM